MKRSSNHLFGATILGERGQVVIPMDIRKRLGLKPGARLVVMHQKNGPVVIFPADRMSVFLKKMNDQVAALLKAEK